MLMIYLGPLAGNSPVFEQRNSELLPTGQVAASPKQVAPLILVVLGTYQNGIRTSIVICPVPRSIRVENAGAVAGIRSLKPEASSSEGTADATGAWPAKQGILGTLLGAPCRLLLFPVGFMPAYAGPLQVSYGSEAVFAGFCRLWADCLHKFLILIQASVDV